MPIPIPLVVLGLALPCVVWPLAYRMTIGRWNRAIRRRIELSQPALAELAARRGLVLHPPRSPGLFPTPTAVEVEGRIGGYSVSLFLWLYGRRRDLYWTASLEPERPSSAWPRSGPPVCAPPGPRADAGRRALVQLRAAGFTIERRGGKLIAEVPRTYADIPERALVLDMVAQLERALDGLLEIAGAHEVSSPAIDPQGSQAWNR